MSDTRSVRVATAIGGGAIVLWSTFAVMAVIGRNIPAFQLLALAFAVSGLSGLVVAAIRRTPFPRIPARVWAVGIGGLFGYHLFFFLALRNAPPVEANLVNYLWPLLIVVISGLLPGERLRPRHVIGAILGLIGTTMLIGGGTLVFHPADAWGFGLAALSAFIWAAYSVLSRRFGEVPTVAVAGYCTVSAILALCAHAGLETWVWPNKWEWLLVAALGFGPMGGAFYAWDVGMKKGDIRALGGLAYVAPLLSTLFLILGGFGVATVGVAIAAALIVGGGWLASADVLSGKSR